MSAIAPVVDADESEARASVGARATRLVVDSSACPAVAFNDGARHQPRPVWWEVTGIHDDILLYAGMGETYALSSRGD
jgi:hypothetical protein